MRLNAVDPRSLSLEALRLFTERTPLLTAGDQSACNTMTIGWGGFGGRLAPDVYRRGRGGLSRMTA